MNSTALFRLAVGAIALRVLDDTVLQPAPGTSIADHPVSALVPLTLLGAAAWIFPRLRGAGRGALALLLGVFGIATGVDAVYYATETGVSSGDLSGFLALPAGLTLIGLGAATLWRTRDRTARRVWRYPRRALLGIAGFLVLAMVVFPVGLAYVMTHVAGAEVPADRLGVPHEDITFETADGLELEGWYIPSRNGAAVIVTPGRRGPQAQARMLARHGYGVLIFDRRGEGASDGTPNVWGWGGDADIKAAIAFLERRPDVHDARIGGLGLSVGGELMLETAAETRALKAVVSEGAGARTMAEELDEDIPAGDHVPTAIINSVRDAGLAVFSNTARPRHLEDLVPRIAPRPVLLIAAPNSPNGEELNRRYAKAGKVPLWEIPESKHVGGIRARPAEYERRVVGFFDDAL